MPTCDWHVPDDKKGHGALWHAAMSILTIAGIGIVALLVALVAVPR